MDTTLDLLNSWRMDPKVLNRGALALFLHLYNLVTCSILVIGWDRKGDVSPLALWSEWTTCWDPNVLLMAGVLLYPGQGLEGSDAADW